MRKKNKIRFVGMFIILIIVGAGWFVYGGNDFKYTVFSAYPSELSETIGGTVQVNEWNSPTAGSPPIWGSNYWTKQIGTYHIDYTQNNIIVNDVVYTSGQTVDNKFTVNIIKADGQPLSAISCDPTAMNMWNGQVTIPSTVSNQIEVHILNLTASTYQYTDLNAVVGVNNNYIGQLNTQLKVIYTVESPWGDETHTLTRDIVLPLGVSNYTFEIPSNTQAFMTIDTQLFFKGSDEFIYSGTGQKTGCEMFGVQKCSFCWPEKLIPITTISEKRILINPAPITLPDAGDCRGATPIEHYTCVEKTGIWYRTDIWNNELGCQQTGCLQSANLNVVCQSDGFCGEGVSAWIDCTDDSQCSPTMKCYSLVGVCIESTLFDQLTDENVIQCEVNTDCLNPCVGMSAYCVDNTCGYEGSCDIQQVQCFQSSDCPNSPCLGVDYSCESNACVIPTGSTCNPNIIISDCNNGVTCPDGSVCKLLADKYVCQNTEVQEKIINNTIVGPTVVIKEIPSYLYYIIGLLIVGVVGFGYNSLRKKSRRRWL